MFYIVSQLNKKKSFRKCRVALVYLHVELSLKFNILLNSYNVGACVTGRRAD